MPNLMKSFEIQNKLKQPVSIEKAMEDLIKRKKGTKISDLDRFLEHN
jgi:hypothetical protein